MSSQRVLVTGATGFFGLNLMELLAQQDVETIALVRPTSDVDRLRAIVPAIKTVACDLQDVDTLRACLRQTQPTLCIHLGWYAVPGKYTTARENLDMLAASINLMGAAAEAGCGRFIGAGTCSEYDPRYGYLSEETPYGPWNLYASTKLSLSLMLEQFSQLEGMSQAWARIFYQYGPWEDKSRLIPYAITELLNDRPVALTPGGQVRDYLHIADVVSAIWAVACSDVTGPVNVGSGQPVTVKDAVLSVGRLLGREELIQIGARPYTTGEPMFICANNARLVSHTGWRPSYTLEEGLSHTIEWWRTHSLQ